MKRRQVVLIIAFCLGLLASSGFVTWRALANTQPSDDQLSLVKNEANCLAAKTTLSRLHSSDALMRVNLGQSYELISTRLIKRFNDRANGSGYQVANMVELTSRYQLALDDFRDKYKIYEEQLSDVMSLDCVAKPANFYNSLMLAREKRLAVAGQVVVLNQMLDEYSALFEAFVGGNNL